MLLTCPILFSTEVECPYDIFCLTINVFNCIRWTYSSVSEKAVFDTSYSIVD